MDLNVMHQTKFSTRRSSHEAECHLSASKKRRPLGKKFNDAVSKTKG